MKVVILAAGMGKRFRRINLPKPLTTLINGHTILDLQLKQLTQYVSIHEIIVVVGYNKEKLLERYPELLFVYNPNYQSENTSKSLLRAINKVDDDLLWLNGDVVFHPDALEQFLATRDENKMLVNVGEVGEEEVKYDANASGQILHVSKELNPGQGEALGINFFTNKDLPKFQQCLESCKAHDYFEKGIELFIQQKGVVRAITIPQQYCMEIDFPADLDRANQLITSWLE